MTIYFLQFLPKINRIVKSYPDLSGYSSFIIQEIGPIDATNFKYNDGIRTAEFYNFTSDKMPDYAIIVNDQNIVTSRWYIEETKWWRNGQWRVTFLRDVLADFKDEVLKSTCLIEKATVSDNDPAIYNQEKATFNMIKKSETILKDATNSAWLVGYISQDGSADKIYQAVNSTQVDIRVNNLADWQYAKFINRTYYGVPRNLSFNVKVGNSGLYLMQYAFNNEGPAQTDNQNPGIGYCTLQSGDWGYNQLGVSDPAARTVFYPKLLSSTVYGPVYSTVIQVQSSLRGIFNPKGQEITDLFLSQYAASTASEESYIRSLNGKKIYDVTANKTYLIRVGLKYENDLIRYAPPKDSALYIKIADYVGLSDKVSRRTQTNANVDDIYVKLQANVYNMLLEEVQTAESTVEITSSRRILNDAPYTMFAIPFGSVSYKKGASTYRSDSEASISIARQISLDLMSSGALYDLQLLPYCPRTDLINTGFIDLRSTVATEHQDYEIITDENATYKSFILFAKESSFTFDINVGIDITEKKVQNQCDSWRLCSPNYNGVFEFNAAKNNGVDLFNVDCTYRPYNPYIHVNPNFKELYGNDFDDARGLICSGDFSMPACSDRWLEYEAQNKNYQNSFDRSIQHMEIEQKYQRIGQIASAVAGVGTGVVGGGAAGGIGGAIAGGAASAVGGAIDLYMAERLRGENIQYSKDQFAFNLENIKALPNSLAKISAFTKNNKIFPFLEHYSCTDIEREAFRNILKYEGMTVNRIGRIIDFLIDGEIQYIRASIIRLEDLHDDQHIINEIASELAKGVYYDTRSD